VVCLVRDWVPESEAVVSGALGRCRVVRGELEDYELMLRALNEYEVDTIFHLGAQTIVGTATRSPLSTFESNIKGTWVLLEAARQLGARIERVIVASSDKAYGAHETLPYTEDAPLIGRFPYDVSKSCADLISLSYFHSFRLPVAVTRCGNLYGGGDLNFNRLVPGTIRSALLGRTPVIRSDGSFVRDYFFVRDAVEAYLALAARVPPGDLEALDAWLGGDLGRRITALEVAASRPDRDSERAIRAGIARLAAAPEARKKLIENLVESTRAAEAITHMTINVAVAVQRGMASVKPEGPVAPVATLREAFEAQRAQMQRAYGGMSQALFADMYQALSDAELAGYLEFLRGAAGRQFLEATMQAMEHALVDAAERLGARLPAVRPGPNI
jgi:nucleoside-diphosphate-sugar epimerase